jgi:protein SCO1
VTLARSRWAVWGAAALIGLVVGATLVAVRSSSPKASTSVVAGPATTWASGRKPAPAFDLKDQNGNPVSIAAFRGRPLIVTFIDPLCRNYCPIEASRLNAVVRSLPPAQRPAILAVSVDVYGNARRYLVQDIQKWKVGSEWHWAIGSSSQLNAVWNHYEIGVLVTTKKIAGVAVHNITHTEAAYIVDAKGDERALYLWPFSAADVKSTLTALSS